MKHVPKLSAVHKAVLIAIGTATAGAPAAAEIEEITVTATKREESAQDIPITVQTLGEQSLEDLGITNFKDYIKSLPGVTSGGRGPGRNEVFIRGLSIGKLGLKAAGILQEPNVAFYLDEAPISIGGRNFDPYMTDMNRVEVLPGPQGTLFGASSQAGTVRLITNKPQFNDFSVGFDASIANTSGGELSNSLEGHVNIPLIDDKLAARVAMYNAKEGGYIDNIAGTKQITLANPSLSVLPAERATAYNDDLAEDNFNDATYQGIRVGVKWAVNDEWDVLVQQFHQEIETEGVWDYDPALGELKSQSFSPDRGVDELDMTSWTVNGRLANLELVYTGAYVDRVVDAVQDYSGYADAGPFIPYYICEYPGYAVCGAPDLFVDSFFGVERTTHEFRVSTDPERRVRGILGVFTDDLTLIERGNWNYPDSALQGFPQNGPITGATASDPNPRPPGVRFFNDFTRGKEELSFFGEVAFDITETFTATVGARNYDLDISLNGSSNFAGRGATDGDGGNNIDVILAGQSPANLSDTILKFNVQWQPNDEINLYATWSEGYRPGGFNRNGGASATPGVPPFVPFFYETDELENLEFGWKTRLLDGSLQFNGAIYSVDWTGLQLATLDFTVSNLTFIQNVGEAEVSGIEIDTIWAPTDQLTLFANVSYNDTELTKLPPTIISLAPVGSPLALAPELQYVLRGRYEWELADGNGVFTQLMVSHTDDVISSINAGALFPQPSYDTVDLSIGYRRDDWSATFFVENLTDELATLFISNEDDIIKTTPNRPRTVGLRFSYRWDE
ncbi:MAG: TonB-dependent receptor [Gammaproteobacteria bacterium]|nr:TonB-dependent receptor [Woeseia sp.]MBU2677852.1 TonB-dependent receptor [Gammaproteobacteria bacterium]NNL51585.1 TonB-dependent receptor [Woeseiaceae bacterium]